MSKYKCIIFDCDGVLVDSEPISNGVLVDMANNLGASIDLEYAFEHFKGESLQTCVEKISTLVTIPIPKTFVDDYRRKSFEVFEKEMKPINGIKNVLDNLKMPFAVASSGPENKIVLNLKVTGLFPYFENTIFSCYAIQKWKPDPDVYLWAAKTMGFKPQECLVIEDSVSGVQAAKNGGFDVFGFTEHDYNNKLATIATKTFNRMEDLLPLIEK